MQMRQLLVSLMCALLLAGCGGGTDAPREGVQVRSAALLASSVRVFEGARVRYHFFPADDGRFVMDLEKGSTVFVPAGARLHFADISLALDTGGDAGRLFRLYQAAFARAPDPAGIGYWLQAMEQGATLEAIAQGFADSAEYRVVYGEQPSHAQIVDRYYQNVLGRAGDPGGIAFWRDALDRGIVTPAGLLAEFSASAENRARTARALADGIEYLEPGVSYLPHASPGIGIGVEAGEHVRLDGSLSTVGAGRAISYTWTLSTRPEGSAAVLEQAADARPSLRTDLPGDYKIKLSVSDGSTTSAVATTTVTALWRPDAGLLPATGNAAYLESDPGDFVGAGRSYRYTALDSVMTARAPGSSLTLIVDGDEYWIGNFKLGSEYTRLAPGYRGLLGIYDRFSAAAGLNWEGEGRTCGAGGWFVVDDVAYQDDKLVAIDLRFEQRCATGDKPALRGRVRWSATGTVALAPSAPPPDLWRPAAGAVPAGGNVVFLQSEPGDLIGRGQTLTFTHANARLDVGASGPGVKVAIEAGDRWTGDFAGMANLSRLEPGYYGDLQRFPFHNPAKGGLQWSGAGSGCNTLRGWFVVDHVAYQEGKLSELELRFEQRCEVQGAPLHGQIRWRAADVPQSAR
jgi:hypothetical protein